jgi:hypothetical protein
MNSVAYSFDHFKNNELKGDIRILPPYNKKFS